MSNVKRHFLGWEKPFLFEAANYLQEHHLRQQLGANDHILILVSGQDVARRLQSILVEHAAETGRAMVLPRIVTPAQCLEELMVQRGNIADLFTARLAIATALRTSDIEQVHNILGTRPPTESGSDAWFAVAKQVQTTIARLAGGGHTAQTETWPEEATSLLTEAAKQRFSALLEVQKKTEGLLQEDGRVFLESSLLQLLDQEQEVAIGQLKHVVLVGTSDLPALVTKTLSRLMESDVSVEALIRAPKETTHLFDSFGCVDAKLWRDIPIEIPDSCIRVAGSPSNQAKVVLEELANLEQTCTTDEIAIACTDEASIPSIRRHLSGFGIQNRSAGGTPTNNSRVAMLLKAIGDVLQDSTFRSFASLVRHPDVASLLGVDDRSIKALDTYAMDVVPQSIQPDNWFTSSKRIYGNEELISLHSKVFSFLETAVSLQIEKGTIYVCSQAIRSLLLAVYGDETLDRKDPKLLVLQKVFAVLDQLDATPPRLASQYGTVDVAKTISMILQELEQTTIPEYPNPEAIEFVGWLEAKSLDTPNLIVVGMSADLSGSGSTSDAYIPDSLCQALGLMTTDRTVARDAHAMTAMQQMRSSTAGSREKITWIVARKNIKGDPLTPSPLLLRCEETDTLARRAERLVVAIEHEKPEVPTQFMPKRIGSGIDVPCPLDFDFDPVDRVSVTAIRDYIACPYRFWLKHVLKLKVVEDCATELSPMLFGSLVHKAVEAFGKDGSINTSRNATEIRAYLSKSLDDVVQSRFGNNVSGMVRVQVEIARDRLLEVAVHQAESASEGWTILRSEVHYPKKVMIEGKPMTISGIIDRIDMHEDGRVRVLDYKTGGATANDAHFKKRDGQWIDLQLPLYRLLLSEVPELQGYDLGFENVSLGYFRIGDQEQNTGIDLLDLPLDVLASADDCIHSILLDIQNSNFGEFPTDPAPKYSDDLAWICQDNNITEEPKGDEL